MTPVRIQRQRTKGWRMPEGAVYVGRPSRWGNEYVIGGYCSAIHTFHPQLAHPDWRTGGRQVFDQETSLAHYRADAEWFTGQNPPWLAALRGHDLACWCPLDQPCHADVLLELANVPGGQSGAR